MYLVLVHIRILSVLYNTKHEKTFSRGRDFTLYVPHQKIIKGLFAVAQLLAAHLEMIADSIVIRW